MTAGRRAASPAVACFCRRETGHFQRLRPLVAGLVRRGVEAHVYTHQDYIPKRALGRYPVSPLGPRTRDDARARTRRDPGGERSAL